MPTPIPPTQRPLSKAALAAALATAKTRTYGDVPAATRSSSYTSTTSATSGAGIRTIAWSPLGSLIATADARILRVWNAEKSETRYSTELRPPITAPSLGTATGDPVTNGKLAAAATATATSRTSSKPTPAPAHLTGTDRVAWHPRKEAELASVGSDGLVRFWDVRSRDALVGEVRIGGEGFSMAWRPNGNDVVIGRKDDTLMFIERRSLSIFAQHPQPIQTNQIAFTNGGDELLLTTGDGNVKIVAYPSMTTLETLRAHTSSCYCVAHSPRGNYIAIGGSDTLITLYDTEDLVCQRSLSDMTGPVRSLSFSFDGAYVVGGSDEGTGLMIAHIETGEYIHTIPTAQPASCVAWHPSRYWLAYSGDPAGLKVVGAGGAVS